MWSFLNRKVQTATERPVMFCAACEVWGVDERCWVCLSRDVVRSGAVYGGSPALPSRPEKSRAELMRLLSQR